MFLKQWLPFIFLFLLIAGCTEEKKKSSVTQQPNPLDDAKTAVEREYKTAEVKVVKNGQSFDAFIRYTPTEFRYLNEQSDKNLFMNTHYQRLSRLSNQKIPFGTFDVTAVTATSKMVANPSGQLHMVSENNSSLTREAAHLKITKQELQELVSRYDDPQFKIAQYVEFYPWFLIELRLRSGKAGITNLMAAESLDTDNLTKVEIFYQPKGSNTLGSTPKDKLNFENDFADLIRISFESSPAIKEIMLSAQAHETDGRGANTSTIASFRINRTRFDNIMSDWDDFRFNIYKEINYTPIFLADLLSASTIDYMIYNETAYINASYFSSDVSSSVSTIQEDAVKLIYGLFANDRNLKRIHLVFKGQVPVKEIPQYITTERKQQTADGANQIIPEFMAVTVTRDQANMVNPEKLTPIQIIYNFDAYWNDLPMAIRAQSGLGLQAKHIRDVSVMGNVLEVTIDVCAFSDKTGKSTTGTVNDRVRVILNNSIYKTHPPFITDASARIEKVFIEENGYEKITHLGDMVIKKDPNTNYWYQTTISPKWITTSKSSVSVPNNAIVCQIP